MNVNMNQVENSDSNNQEEMKKVIYTIKCRKMFKYQV